MHRRVHVGQARVLVRGRCRVRLVERACPVAVRPDRVAWRALRVVGCLRARSRADPVGPVLMGAMRAALRRLGQARVPLPVGSWRVQALQRVTWAPLAL